MKPVFANSAFVCAPERFVLRGGRWQSVRLKVRYGVFRHPAAGLVLMDTGYGPNVTQGGRSLPLRLNNAVLGPQLVANGAPKAVLERLGASPADVKAIIVSHFHADHVSNLDLFPQARIFAKAQALERIRQKSGWQNLRHGFFEELLPAGLETRLIDLGSLALRDAPLGLGMGRDLFSDGSVLAIDLPGHAEEHIGLCFPRLPRPLLYAVDVQWLLAALAEEKRPGLPASLIAQNSRAAAQSAQRVLAFRAAGGDVLLCHDPNDSPFDLGEGAP